MSRSSEHPEYLDRILEKTSQTALHTWGVPEWLAEEARTATVRRFATGGSHDAGISERRLEAYFWGVVRRRAFRGGAETGDLRRRFVEASLAA